jgi:hypothetical protein
MKGFITSLTTKMLNEASSLILDFGGGERVLEEYGRDVAFLEFCESVGIEPLSIYMIGPELDDFEHVLSIFRAGYFRARRSLLVMNESLALRDKTTAGAFNEIFTHPGFEEMAKEVMPVSMFRLPCMTEMRSGGLTFYEAADNKRTKSGKFLDPIHQFQITNWLSKMEKEFELKGITEWLP